MRHLKFPEFRVTEKTKDSSSTSGFYVRCATPKEAEQAYRRAYPLYSKGKRLRVERWKEPQS